LTVGPQEGSPSSNETALEVVAGLLIGFPLADFANPKHLSLASVVHQPSMPERRSSIEFRGVKKIHAYESLPELR
jgi:hypothetical protein